MERWMEEKGEINQYYKEIIKTSKTKPLDLEMQLYYLLCTLDFFNFK